MSNINLSKDGLIPSMMMESLVLYNLTMIGEFRLKFVTCLV